MEYTRLNPFTSTFREGRGQGCVWGGSFCLQDQRRLCRSDKCILSRHHKLLLFLPLSGHGFWWFECCTELGKLLNKCGRDGVARAQIDCQATALLLQAQAEHSMRKGVFFTNSHYLFNAFIVNIKNLNLNTLN